MVAGGHSTADPLLRANAPVLGESLRAVDGRCVDASTGVGQLAGGVVGAVRVEDVVFDERVAGPTVDAEVGVAVGLEGAGVFDGSVCIVLEVGYDDCGMRA
jgi:hypothetical protein